MSSRYKLSSAIVVGGGIAGLGVARGLHRRGVEVTVVDRLVAGSGASYNNAGWVSPVQTGPLPSPEVLRGGIRSLLMPESPLYIAPTCAPSMLPWLIQFARSCAPRAYDKGARALLEVGYRSFRLLDDLEREGFQTEIGRRGLVAAGSTDSVRAFLRLISRNVNLEEKPELRIGEKALLDLEPALSATVEAATRLADHRQIHPPQFITTLVSHLRGQGVQILEGREVLDIFARGRSSAGVRTQLGCLHADAVVIAAGAASASLARMPGWKLPVVAGKGYSLELDSQVPPAHSIILTDAHVGVIPAAQGVRLAGTMEFSGTNLRVDARRVKAMIDAARPRLRGLGDRPRGPAWVGLRPLAPDGLPIVDGIPDRGIWVATAYSMLGMTVGLPLGELLAEWMCGADRPRELEPFAATRRRAARIRG
jgi:D-amino-acid dehydrogenase